MHTTPKVICRGTDTYTHSLTHLQTHIATEMAAAAAGQRLGDGDGGGVGDSYGVGTDNNQLKLQKWRRLQLGNGWATASQRQRQG